MVARNILVLVLLQLIVSIGKAEDVCENDYTLVKRIGVTEVDAGVPPIRLVRQAGSFVQFRTSNAWSHATDGTLEHLYASYHADPMGSRQCTLEEALPSFKDSETMTAYCTPNNATMVRLYVRDTNFSSTFDTASIPECCHDPDPSTHVPAIEYLVKIECNPTCNSPSTYMEPAPAGYANDVVYGKLQNGPFQGASHSWAWRSPNGQCDMASKTNVDACGVDAQQLDRVLKFESSYFDFEIQFDNGMQAIFQLADGTTEGGRVQAAARSFYPAKSNAVEACDSPATNPGTSSFPIRLVRSGNHFHHWYVDDFQCDTSTRMEIKVTPD
ncbi:MAG: hypothetical protein SGILL_006788, partial [Bacillariaceae sp.]